MLTPSQSDFLNQFDAVAQVFAPDLECCVYTRVSRLGCEFEVHVLHKTGATETTITEAKGKTKKAALANLTTALREVYGNQPPQLSTAPKSTTYEQRIQLLDLVNRGCFDRSTKTTVMLNIYQWSEQKAAAKIDELQLAIEHHEAGPYGLRGEAYTIQPAA
jgi:hypothetical protein